MDNTKKQRHVILLELDHLFNLLQQRRVLLESSPNPNRGNSISNELAKNQKIVLAMEMSVDLAKLELPTTLSENFIEILQQLITEMVDTLEPPIELNFTSDVSGHQINCTDCTNVINNLSVKSNRVVPYFELETFPFKIAEMLWRITRGVINNNTIVENNVPSLQSLTVFKLILYKLQIKLLNLNPLYSELKMK